MSRGALLDVAPHPRNGLDLVLGRLAPAGVRVGSRRISPRDLATLHPSEHELVEIAVTKRRCEFATGRALLRALLDDDQPIGTDGGRAPRWPAGVRGSLAHDDRYAVAAISRDPAVAAIGIDVEPATVLSDDMAQVIVRPDERLLDAHLAFSLKEAAYKAWSSLGGRMLDHHDVFLTVDAGRFAAHVVADGVTFEGSYAIEFGRIVALVVAWGNRP